MKLVIFDLDGTLINSLDDLADAANYALKKFGYPVHPVESFKYFVGNGVPKLIERVLPENERTPERIEEVKSVFDLYYNNHSTDKTRPYDGIEELVAALKKNGYKIAVASNKSDSFTQALVKQFFGNSFDYVQGALPGVPKKPEPDIVYSIMSRLGSEKNDTYFAGDSNVDMFTAKNAGVTAIGCLWGFRTKEELLSGGADHLAEKPSDIYNIIEREYNV